MIGYKIVRKIGDKFFSHNLQCVVEYKLGEPAFAYPGSTLFVFGTESHAEHFWLASEAYYNCQVWEVEYTPEHRYVNADFNPYDESVEIIWQPLIDSVSPVDTPRQIYVPRGTVFASSVTLLRKVL